MLGGFRPSKCKTSCKLCVSRIKLLRNKRNIQVTQQRREIAQLLREGKNEYAWIRVEAVIRESNLLAAYEILELYLELISVRANLLEKQKTCPRDMVEAITTLMYAAPRVADLPELTDVRKILSSKFGRELGVEGARDLNGEEPPNWQVNLRLRHYLGVEAPDPEDKLTTISSIAEECNVEFNMEDYAQNVMVRIDPIIPTGPPEAPTPAMFEAIQTPAKPQGHHPARPQGQHPVNPQERYPPVNPQGYYPPVRPQGNLPTTVIPPPPTGSDEPHGDRPVMPPAQPSFRVPFRGPSTGLYTDAQTKMIGKAVEDEESEVDEDAESPPLVVKPKLEKTDSEIQRQYDEIPGPPSKHQPSAPPAASQEEEDFPTTPGGGDKGGDLSMDDDLDRRLDELRRR